MTDENEARLGVVPMDRVEYWRLIRRGRPALEAKVKAKGAALLAVRRAADGDEATFQRLWNSAGDPGSPVHEVVAGTYVSDPAVMQQRWGQAHTKLARARRLAPVGVVGWLVVGIVLLFSVEAVEHLALLVSFVVVGMVVAFAQSWTWVRRWIALSGVEPEDARYLTKLDRSHYVGAAAVMVTAPARIRGPLSLFCRVTHFGGDQLLAVRDDDGTFAWYRMHGLGLPVGEAARTHSEGVLGVAVGEHRGVFWAPIRKRVVMQPLMRTTGYDEVRRTIEAGEYYVLGHRP